MESYDQHNTQLTATTQLGFIQTAAIDSGATPLIFIHAYRLKKMIMIAAI